MWDNLKSKYTAHNGVVVDAWLAEGWSEVSDIRRSATIPSCYIRVFFSTACDVHLPRSSDGVKQQHLVPSS